MANTLRILPSAAAENRGTKDTRASERIVTLVPASSPEAKAGISGWDAYEVWRRLIKDARDRRENRCS